MLLHVLVSLLEVVEISGLHHWHRLIKPVVVIGACVGIPTAWAYVLAFAVDREEAEKARKEARR